MREGPYISALPFPDRNGSRPLLAWKQDNNGTTFIASPVHLPWVTEKIWVVESDAGVVTLSPELIAMEDARKKRLKGEPEWFP